MSLSFRFFRRLGLGVGLWWVLNTGLCHANLIFDVSFPAWPGALAPGTPVALFFELTDGSGANDANNIITLDAFDLGGGTPGSATTSGGGTITLFPLQVSLTDTQFDNTVLLPFLVGNGLHFRANLTTNQDSGATPDEFSVFVLDGQGNPLPTTDALASAFLVVDISPTVSLLDVQTFTNVGPLGIGGPRVQPSGAVPEPSTWLLLATGLVGLLGYRWRKRQRTA